MRFFVAREAFAEGKGEFRVDYRPAATPPTLADIRVGSATQLQNLVVQRKKADGSLPLAELAPEPVRALKGFPVELGRSNARELERILALARDGRHDPADVALAAPVVLEEQLKPLLPRRRLQVAILNGLGTGIGDSVIGATALRSFRARLALQVAEVRIDIVSRRLDKLGGLLRCLPEVDRLRPAAISLADLMAYDAVVDLGGMTSWPDFDRLPMLDFFLLQLGLAPAQVPVSARRNHLPLPEAVRRRARERVAAARAGQGPLVLLHPTASEPGRSMPEATARAVADALLARPGWRVASLLPTADPRLVDLSAASADVVAFAALVAEMDGIVTVDTSTYHLADAFDVPSLAIFTTVDPRLRLRDYPWAGGLWLRGGDPWSRLEPATAARHLAELMLRRQTSVTRSSAASSVTP
ncbi:MAG: glycosyltransferase family 9 protein [Geminicoccaceae bacterium]